MLSEISRILVDNLFTSFLWVTEMAITWFHSNPRQGLVSMPPPSKSRKFAHGMHCKPKWWGLYANPGCSGLILYLIFPMFAFDVPRYWHICPFILLIFKIVGCLIRLAIYWWTCALDFSNVTIIAYHEYLDNFMDQNDYFRVEIWISMSIWDQFGLSEMYEGHSRANLPSTKSTFHFTRPKITLPTFRLKLKQMS